MVLIDSLKKHGKKEWAHLVASEIDELHDFAKKLGMKRQWFQNKPQKPHYDVLGKKSHAAAIQLGAKLVSSKEIIIFLKTHYGQ